jgi:hypothetical protein
MSRTKKGSKGPGYEYWKSRLGGIEDPGAVTKKLTHKKERNRSRENVRRVADGNMSPDTLQDRGF